MTYKEERTISPSGWAPDGRVTVRLESWTTHQADHAYPETVFVHYAAHDDSVSMQAEFSGFTERAARGLDIISTRGNTPRTDPYIFEIDRDRVDTYLDLTDEPWTDDRELMSALANNLYFDAIIPVYQNWRQQSPATADD